MCFFAHPDTPLNLKRNRSKILQRDVYKEEQYTYAKSPLTTSELQSFLHPEMPRKSSVKPFDLQKVSKVLFPQEAPIEQDVQASPVRVQKKTHTKVAIEHTFSFATIRTKLPRRQKRKSEDVFDEKHMISNPNKRSRLSLPHSLTCKHESSPPRPEKRKRADAFEDEDISDRSIRLIRKRSIRIRKCVQDTHSNKRRRTNMNVLTSLKHTQSSPPRPDKRKRADAFEDEDISDRRIRLLRKRSIRIRKCVQDTHSNKRRRTNMNVLTSLKQ